MDIIFGAIAAVCFYFAWRYTRYFWHKYKIDKKLINDKIDGQSFVAILFFLTVGSIMVMEVTT